MGRTFCAGHQGSDDPDLPMTALLEYINLCSRFIFYHLAKIPDITDWNNIHSI